jgi:anti-sigma factor RsiW
MTCDDVRPLLAASHDGELDAAGVVQVEEHLRGCERCRAQIESLRTLSRSVQPAFFAAPAGLRGNILAAIAESEPATNVVQLPRRSAAWLWQGLSLAAALVLGFFVAQLFHGQSTHNALVAQLTDSHVRSLIGTHLTDVATSDQHTVRPWFEGKLDFAPPVEDLSGAGFPLVGGRIEYVNGRAVAALVYERRKHFINLFVWPKNGTEDVIPEKPQRGYNILHWTRNGMTYWALSEIAEDDLRKFAREFATTR